MGDVRYNIGVRILVSCFFAFDDDICRFFE